MKYPKRLQDYTLFGLNKRGKREFDCLMSDWLYCGKFVSHRKRANGGVCTDRGGPERPVRSLNGSEPVFEVFPDNAVFDNCSDVMVLVSSRASTQLVRSLRVFADMMEKDMHRRGNPANFEL